MTLKDSEYKLRKDLVLRIVVSEYITTVNPVSSGFIADKYHLDFSSATIRNILADLEKEGQLTHPHTSAGRIPTQDGYRYYVDHLMNEIQLLAEEKERIKTEYQKQVRDLEYLLDKTSEAISDFTQYTSIVSIDGREDRIYYKGTGHIVEYVDPQDVSRISDILRALEEKERILEIINQDIQERFKIYIGHEMACQQMDQCSLAVSRYEIPNGPTGRIAVLGPTRMNYQRVVSALDYFSDLLRESFKDVPGK